MDANLKTASQEAQEHAQAVFARMSERRRLPAAQRAKGQRRRAENSQATAPMVAHHWEAGQDKALPSGDRE